MRTEMNYDKLDERIREAIRFGSLTPTRNVTFSFISGDTLVREQAHGAALDKKKSDPLTYSHSKPEEMMDRIIDARLQSMRKSGKLRYERRYGWRLSSGAANG